MTKTFSFNNNQDPTQPARIWFEESAEGLTLFVVFYTLACTWGKCTACNLPSVSASTPIKEDDLIKQVDALFSYDCVAVLLSVVKKIIVSNNGSMLDEQTFAQQALIHLIQQAYTYIPNLTTFTIETRAEFITPNKLKYAKEILDPNEIALEIAIGLEAHSPHVRNVELKKGLTNHALEHAARICAEHGCTLKCYVMQKPIPNMTHTEATEDAKKCVDYLDYLAKQFNIRINIHLFPTYVARGTILERCYLKGTYEPPKLTDVIRVVMHAQTSGLTVTVGLFDEGLAIEPMSIVKHEDEALVKAISGFNYDQDFNKLRRFINPIPCG